MKSWTVAISGTRTQRTSTRWLRLACRFDSDELQFTVDAQREPSMHPFELFITSHSAGKNRNRGVRAWSGLECHWFQGGEEPDWPA